MPIVNQTAAASLPQERNEPSTPAAGGELIVTVRDQAGAPVANACATLDQARHIEFGLRSTERDANDQPGQIDVADLTPGTYTLNVIPPEGFEAPLAAPIELMPDQPESCGDRRLLPPRPTAICK